MRLLELPPALAKRGLFDWPTIVVLEDKNDSVPPGTPYLIGNGESDDMLLYRLMIPMMQKKFKQFDWTRIYHEVFGEWYEPILVHYEVPENEVPPRTYGEPVDGVCDVTLKDLACDVSSYVDLDLLTDLKMLPKFFGDLAEAIKVNVTNSYQWIDGYNKKTGLCSGYLQAQPRKKSLVILDISYSIPDGVSSAMMTLIKTVTDVTHADLVLTAGKSYFYTNEEVRVMDVEAERRRIPRGNESDMFNEILKTHHMDYDVVISFGDSDAPEVEKLDYPIHTKTLYDCFLGERDGYGSSYKTGTGYARWVTANCKDVEVVHNTDWARFFTRKG
ncbi:hypothetical protein [uncultured Bifidobacterium sp.]|uniref:hypothetical protein n=1 Tax=uncultured Bifidobacterium sp. TaxID=165187 RepID=UPI002632BAF7|nr:hypothetical protein [uncultured Bifidobacterium sp.]